MGDGGRIGTWIDELGCLTGNRKGKGRGADILLVQNRGRIKKKIEGGYLKEGVRIMKYVK